MEGSELSQVWHDAVALLAQRLPNPAQHAWLDTTEPVGFSGSTIVLAAPNDFTREQLEKRYAGELRSALSDVAHRDIDVMVTTSAGPRAVAVAAPHVPPPRASPPTEAGSGDYTLKYTFDRFVIGPSNRFAHAAALAVAEAPAHAYNPLFIYGGAGLGKTHLLQAVAHYAGRLYPQLKIVYRTSEQFTNEFIEAVRNGRQQGFRRYRDVDILLVDDIQFLEKAEQTQEEFFHTFNTLHQRGKQIVLTSDRPPRRIERLEERLRTRFEMGLITDVQPPDLETRLAILRRKADHEHLRIPHEVLNLIATRISSNIRELEGALIRVCAAANLGGTEVTLDLAEVTLRDVFSTDGATAITSRLVMEETASYFDLTLDQLCSTTRTRALVNARQIAMYLTRELTDLSLPKIGQAFGGRDHSTVIHANRKIAKLIAERPATYQHVQELTSRIKTRARGRGV